MALQEMKESAQTNLNPTKKRTPQKIALKTNNNVMCGVKLMQLTG